MEGFANCQSSHRASIILSMNIFQALESLKIPDSDFPACNAIQETIHLSWNLYDASFALAFGVIELIATRPLESKYPCVTR